LSWCVLVSVVESNRRSAIVFYFVRFVFCGIAVEVSAARRFQLSCTRQMYMYSEYQRLVGLFLLCRNSNLSCFVRNLRFPRSPGLSTNKA
jgi:hypothetical protein